jgi:FKBP-type peptidyl-prolyl cis-trans isomerase 2
VAGAGQIIPGLEAALDGKAVRERVKVKIAPEQAYGLRDVKNMQEVPLDKIPEDARTVGTLLSAQGIDGPIRVAEVRPDVVVLDYNHPLAGKALTFDVLVLSIN